MKTTLEDLAIFGGEQAFTQPLYVGKPGIGNREQFLQEVEKMIDRRWFTNAGPCVQKLERRISEYLGVKHAIAMCNGTVALEITIRALELSGEVIIPSFTFIATAHALQWQQITPVFCDIDPATHNLDANQASKLISSRTTGIISVHLWGRPCNTEALEELARQQDLHLVYDASHAFGCSHQGTMIGSFGDAEIFSFHATKAFHTFEGGAIATNNDQLAEKIRLMKNFGFSGYDNVVNIGTNGKMAEVNAIMGLVNLDAFDDTIKMNHANYEAYKAGLANVEGITLNRYDESEKCNFHYIVIEVNEEKAGISRDRLVDLLHRENVIARRYFYPGCHKMEPYKSLFPQAGLHLPQTEQLARRVICLPSGPEVSTDKVKDICKLIEFATGNGNDISASWPVTAQTQT